MWCSGIIEIYGWLWGSICHGYMCILLYMKHVWCSGFPEIYAQLEEGVGSICHGYMCIHISSVVASQRSMVNWGGSICHGYMCILLYVKLMWCSGFHRCIVDWLRGRGSICHGYMCILLSMKLVLYSGFPESILNWRRGGVNLPWVYVHCAIYETYLV